MKFINYIAVIRIAGEDIQTLIPAKNAREATMIATVKFGKLFIKLL